MQQDITAIKQLCKDYKTEPKLLIIPGSRMKMQILHTLTDHDIFPLNLHVYTIGQLAGEIAKLKIDEMGYTQLEDRDVAELIGRVMESLRNTNKLKYFDMQITAGLCDALTRTVLELLSCCVCSDENNISSIYDIKIGEYNLLDGLNGDPKDKSPDKSKSELKKADIELILSNYLEQKKSGKFIDRTDITRIAQTALSQYKPEFVGVYVLPQCECNPLEERLIEEPVKQTDAARSVISADKPEAIDSPENDFSKLKFKNADFFSAYGDYNEVKEVLRRIILNPKSGSEPLLYNPKPLPFDSVLIVTPDNEPYTQLFYQLLKQYNFDIKRKHGDGFGLPITFAAGIPLTLSSPAQFLMLLLDWIEGEYKKKDLISLIDSGLVQYTGENDSEDDKGDKKEKFGSISIINTIKSSNITWKRETYKEFTEKSKNEQTLTGAAKWLCAFVNDVFEKIPEHDADKPVDGEALLKGLSSIVEKYARKQSSFDNIGENGVLKQLNPVIKSKAVNLNNAIKTIRRQTSAVRIMQESPQPGKMHLVTYEQAAWINRENVFVIGLGADNFPGSAIEDPILLDNEREGTSMPTSKLRTEMNLKIMFDLLENIKENNGTNSENGINITFSYSAHDTIENRESFPAVIYHELSVSNGKDIENIKKTVVGFLPKSDEHFIEKGDYWFNEVKKLIDEKDPQYSSPRQLDKNVLIPQLGTSDYIKKLSYSATSLGDYLQCKHKFFLKRILELKDPNDVEIYDPFGQLSSSEKGTIYHKIIETFLNDEVIEKRRARGLPLKPFEPEESEKEEWKKRIEEITREVIKDEKTKRPSPQNILSEMQEEQLLSDLNLFIEYEIDNINNRCVIGTEVKFVEDKTVNDADANKTEPLEIELSDGISILTSASGSVDRINRLACGGLEIIDYKSGGTYKYEDLKSPKDAGITEANVQLALYYLALHQKIEKQKNKAQSSKNENEIDGEIKRVAYHFLTAKGSYRSDIAIETSSADAEIIKRKFTELITEVNKFQFSAESGNMQEEEKAKWDNMKIEEKTKKLSCEYCGYATVCLQKPVGGDEDE